MNREFIKILLAVVLFGFGTAQIQAQVCTPAPIGLVSNYSGDGNTLDARARNNGTIQGNVTYAAGQVGQALNLGGTGDTGGNGDRVSVGNPANLRLQDFTIEAWVKRSSSTILTNSPFPGSPNGTIFAYGQNGYGFVIDQNTNRLGLTNVGNSVVNSNLGITDTNWHHVAVTKSGNQVVFYVDGTADTPVTYATTFGFTANAAIGARGDANAQNAFFGAIDELGIYNRPLTVADIQSIYNSGTSGKCKPLATNVPENQVLWLAGDGDALDASGSGNNGTLQNSAGYAVGKSGQAFNFQGANDFVSVNASPSLDVGTGNGLTFETWIRPNSISSAQILVEWGDNANIGAHLALSSVVGGPSPGNISANLVDTGGANHFFDSAPNLVSANIYSHVAVTYDKTTGTGKLFVNGALVANQNLGVFTPRTNTNINLAKRIQQAAFDYKGGMDETAIYNRALTEAEIASIANAGIAGKYKVQSTVPANIAAWYAADGNANDLQGGNNGTLQNGTTFGSGKVGQSFVFDGADDQITVPHNANQNVGSNLTIEAWINPTTVVTHGATILQKRTSGNVGGYVFEPTQPAGGGAPNGLQFVIMIGGIYSTLNPANVLQPNVWQHVAATYDGSFMRIYVNGVEVANKPQTGAIDAVTAPIVIGRNAVNNAGFQGGIDEVSLYNRALTASEIRDVYYAQSGGKYKAASNPTVGNKAKVGETEITFGTITNAGTVHQTPVNPVLLPILPVGTHTGLTYDISTSAAHTNPTVCFNLPSFTSAQFANLRIYHLESGVWQNRTAASNSYPNLCTTGLTSLSPFAIVSVVATAANVSVGGRVTGVKGGLNNVTVTISGGNLPSPVTMQTGSFGYYNFENLSVGETYFITVASKRFTFSPNTRVVTPNQDVADLDFTGETP